MLNYSVAELRFNIKVTETPAGGGLKTDVETYVADWDEILLSPGYE